ANQCSRPWIQAGEIEAELVGIDSRRIAVGLPGFRGNPLGIRAAPQPRAERGDWPVLVHQPGVGPWERCVCALDQPVVWIDRVTRQERSIVINSRIEQTRDWQTTT